MNEITVSELAQAARKVRSAQKQYFKTRDRSDLVASKQAERELDDMLAKVPEQGEPS